jgi:UrcA family protein
MSRHESLAATLVACASLGFILTAPASAAPDPTKVATGKLHYVEADLRTRAGAKAFAGRLRVAAAHVCGDDDIVLKTGFRFYRCQERVLDDALARLDAPLVAEALGRNPSALARR